jgi:cytochrome c1
MSRPLPRPRYRRRTPLSRAFLVAVCLLAGAACRDDAVVPRTAVAGGDPSRAPELVMSYGCGSCHEIPGIPMARGRVGPSLEGFARRSHIAGRMPNEPRALVRWIMVPQAVDPATVMPTLGVTDAHARDIAAYLYTLRGGALGPPSLLSPRAIPGH